MTIRTYENYRLFKDSSRNTYVLISSETEHHYWGKLVLNGRNPHVLDECDKMWIKEMHHWEPYIQEQVRAMAEYTVHIH